MGAELFGAFGLRGFRVLSLGFGVRSSWGLDVVRQTLNPTHLEP